MKRLIIVVSIVSALWACDEQTSSSIEPTSSPIAPSAVQPTVPTRPDAFPPGVLRDYTLSGLVFELTTTGWRPIEGADVYCELCGADTHSWALTDASGIYSFPGVWVTSGARTPVWFGKEGYTDPPEIPPLFNGSGWRQVMVNGDTRFDAQLVRK